MPAPETDVLIHGAGPVGCALALALRGTGLRVAVFDKGSFTPALRPIALSYASRLILERVGAWQAGTPIETARLAAKHSRRAKPSVLHRFIDQLFQRRLDALAL